MIRGEDGRPIARSIARLLSNEEGEPVLYLEDIYSASVSPEIRRVLTDFAIEKAKKLGVPLAVSFTPEGFTLTRQGKLSSYGSRSEFVYTDSGGGLRKAGKFDIIGAHQVARI
jgi:hypothetical protein